MRGMTVRKIVQKTVSKTGVQITLVILAVSIAGASVAVPAALADHPKVTITPVPGSGVPGCEGTPEGCNVPMVATVDVGGAVIMSNTDTVTHTFTSGTVDSGTDGAFDSSFLPPGYSFEWRPDTAGEYPYFCMSHPWRSGMIIVQDSGDHATAVQDFCHDAYYDGGGASLVYEEVCVNWITTSDGYTNTLETDRTFYGQGDLMHIYANQDLRDPQPAVAGHFAMGNAGGTVQAWSLDGDYHTLAVRLLDGLFDPGCYDVSVWYDTPRPDTGEAWDAVEICVVPDDPAGIPPTVTGVQGKVYLDANGNGMLDVGEAGVAGRTVITVNMADFADTGRTTTDANGDYSFGLGAGTYLVQVEGTPSYAYVSVTAGSTTLQHLGL